MAAEIVYKSTIATNEHIPNDVCTMRKLSNNFQTKNELTFEILFSIDNYEYRVHLQRWGFQQRDCLRILFSDNKESITVQKSTILY